MKISEPVKRSREVSLNMGPKKQDKKPKISDVDKEKEMEERAQALMDDIYEAKVVDQTECAKVQLFLTFNSRKQMKDLNKKVDDFQGAYEQKVGEIDGRLDELEKRQRELEILAVAKDLIARNIPIHNDVNVNENGRETNVQTMAQVESFFTSINLTLQPFEFPECHRMPVRDPKPGEAIKAPIILLRFNSIKNIRQLFQCLATEGAKACFDNVNISNSIPPILRDDHSRASRKAFEIRKKGKGFRTKVELDKEGNIKLFTKSKGAKVWASIPF